MKNICLLLYFFPSKETPIHSETRHKQREKQRVTFQLLPGREHNILNKNHCSQYLVNIKKNSENTKLKEKKILKKILFFPNQFHLNKNLCNSILNQKKKKKKKN